MESPAWGPDERRHDLEPVRAGERTLPGAPDSTRVPVVGRFLGSPCPDRANDDARAGRLGGPLDPRSSSRLVSTGSDSELAPGGGPRMVALCPVFHVGSLFW